MVLAALNFTNEEQVIALLVLTQIAAFKDCAAAFEQGHTVHRIMVWRMAEAVSALAGKQLRQGLL